MQSDSIMANKSSPVHAGSFNLGSGISTEVLADKERSIVELRETNEVRARHAGAMKWLMYAIILIKHSPKMLPKDCSTLGLLAYSAIMAVGAITRGYST